MRLALALAAMLLLNVIPTLGLDAIPDYDRQYHLFFADHYQRGWWNPWDTRWFGGFSVYSYPPLAHQLVALLGFPLGLEGGYASLQLLVLVSLPVTIWLLVAELLDRGAADAAAALSVVGSGPYLLLYNYGMLPTLLALSLLWGSLAALLRYLKEGRRIHLYLWWALSAATISAHHFSTIAFLPLLLLAVGPGLLPPRGQRKAFLQRALLAGLGLGVGALLVLLPFWWWLLTQSRPQSEIWQFSRDNLLRDPWTLGPYLVSMWGGGLLLWPWALQAGWSRRSLRPLVVLCAALALLGLGRSSRLPMLMYPGWWRWLTYERFAFWGSMVLLIPLAAWLARQSGRRQVAVLLLMLAFAVRSATITMRQPIMLPALSPVVVNDLKGFFARDGHGSFYYLTLGLGEAELAHVGRTVEAPNLDGIYSTARRDLFLSQSSEGPQDIVAFSPTAAESVVESVMLAHPHAFRLRWVLSGYEGGDAMLRRQGWNPVAQLGPGGYRDLSHSPPGLSQVTIWEAPDAVRVLPADLTAERWPTPRPLPLFWGTLPVLSLAIGLALALRLVVTAQPAVEADAQEVAQAPEAVAHDADL